MISEVLPPVRVQLHGGPPLIRAGVACMLGGHRRLVAVPAHVDALLRPDVVDVVLVDLDDVGGLASLGGPPPLDVVGRLAASGLPVLGLSWCLDAGCVQDALDRGARGYLDKGLPLDQMARAVCRAVHGWVVVRAAAVTASTTGAARPRAPRRRDRPAG